MIWEEVKLLRSLKEVFLFEKYIIKNCFKGTQYKPLFFEITKAEHKVQMRKHGKTVDYSVRVV